MGERTSSWRVGIAAAVAGALIPAQAAAQDTGPDRSAVVVAVEAAKPLEGFGGARPGLRVERVFRNGLSPYLTLGVHPANFEVCIPEDPCGQQSLIEAVVGLNYWPDLGPAVIRLYFGGGLGLLAFSPDGDRYALWDAHAGIEMPLWSGIAVRAELRHLREPRYESFEGPALAAGVSLRL